MGTPYSRQEVAYLVGPIIGEDPDDVQDIIIIAIVQRDGHEQRMIMKGPAYAPLIIGTLVSDCLTSMYETREDESD